MDFTWASKVQKVRFSHAIHLPFRLWYTHLQHGDHPASSPIATLSLYFTFYRASSLGPISDKGLKCLETCMMNAITFSALILCVRNMVWLVQIFSETFTLATLYRNDSCHILTSPVRHYGNNY